MSDQNPQDVKKISMPAKEGRRAAALRENLKKRKAWQSAQRNDGKDAKT